MGRNIWGEDRNAKNRINASSQNKQATAVDAATFRGKEHD